MKTLIFGLARPARRFVNALILGVVLGTCLHARALIIMNGPSFSPATNAPLAGILQISTDVPSRVRVTVQDGTNFWTRNFYDYSTAHSIPLLGFKAGRTNLITVRAIDQNRNSLTAPQPIPFVTSPLPADFPKSVLITNQPSKMEPGYTLLRIANLNDLKPYLTIVDQAGEVIWYSASFSVLDVRQLPDGNLFLPLLTNFVEMNMLGEPVQTWNVPEGLKLDPHEGVPTSHGTILFITDDYATITNFPTETLYPNATLAATNALYNHIIEISTNNGAVLNDWSLLDMLQPARFDYLTYSVGYADLEHANAVIEDPSDDSIVVSMRHQDAVVKFSRATGELIWILGTPDNWDPQFQPYLLTAVGTPFQWQYGQHGPMITPQGNLLLYDDGNFRASPFDSMVDDWDNNSRGVEYAINMDTMRISQVWEFTGTNDPGQIWASTGQNEDTLYTGLMGNTDWLPVTGNVLVHYGWVSYENGTAPSAAAPNAAMVRIKEVTHDPLPEVVFDLAFFDSATTNAAFRGYYAYRSHRIPALYSIQPAPVQDLVVQITDVGAYLMFSGNNVNTYTIQTSPDLQNWTDLAEPVDDGNGNYGFLDGDATRSSIMFYRVLTEPGLAAASATNTP